MVNVSPMRYDCHAGQRYTNEEGKPFALPYITCNTDERDGMLYDDLPCVQFRIHSMLFQYRYALSPILLPYHLSRYEGRVEIGAFEPF